MHRSGLPTQAELRSLDEQVLVFRIDQILDGVPSAEHLLTAQMYRDELLRREQQRSTDAMLGYTKQMLAYTEEMNRMTKQIRNLTYVILAATLLTLGVTMWR